MKYAFIFPGQGSQYVGMGKALADSYAEARAVFEEVSDALSQNITRLMFEGPETDLNLTENTQPALMALSMAVIEVLSRQADIDVNKMCHFVAGHSLGEYAALTAAGAFDLAETARVLQKRGQAMQSAVPVGEGAMAAVLGMDMEAVEAVLHDTAGLGVCELANDNTTGQVVISGHTAAVEAAAGLAKERGAKRAVLLPVSAPFHCSLMAPAAEAMRDVLGDIDIKEPGVPVVSNVTAQAESSPDNIRALLVEQITGRVRWRESVLWMRDNGITHMAEIGAGKVLTGLVRRVDREITCTNVETPQDIDAFVQSLNM